MGWSDKDIPDLAGRVAVVTGASAGLGLPTTRMLTEHGTTVVMACRDPVKAAERARGLDSDRVAVEHLDLADQASVAAFAGRIAERYGRLDLLINNAGVMGAPASRTRDGFETHFGVNHLGHFALTLRLLPLLTGTPGSRVVTVSSTGHKQGRIRLTDPQFAAGGYSVMRAYAQSKLANMLFALELARRLSAAGRDTLSLAAHPGLASTDLGRKDAVGAWAVVVRAAPYLLPHHSADRGALPTLRAATDPTVQNGELYGPRWSAVGPPVRQQPAAHARDPELAGQLWRLSLRLLPDLDPTPLPD